MQKPQTEFEASMYNHLFHSDGKWVLFNAESRFLSEISEALAYAIMDRDWPDLPEEILDSLFKNKVIVHEGHVHDYYDTAYIQFNARNFNTQVLNLVIAPTTACNFDCPYCFEPKKDPKTMTPEVIEQIERFVRFQDPKYLNLTWYGGEPLLAFEQIKSIYEVLTKEDMPEIKDHSIVTNGYLFTEEVCEFFKDKGLRSIQITLDGVEDRHNTTRCLKGTRKPTFKTICENLKTIRRILPDTPISLRVNIDKTNWKEVAEIQRMIEADFGKDCGIYPYPGLIRKETSDGRSLCSECIAPKDVHELHSNLAKEGMDVNLFPKRNAQRGCMMQAANAFIIGPEGELDKCWNDVSDMSRSVGTIFQNELNKSRRLLDYMTLSVPFNEKCRECSVFPLCDGGCSLYRYRNAKRNTDYKLCCAYANPEVLKEAVLSGVILTDSVCR